MRKALAFLYGFCFAHPAGLCMTPEGWTGNVAAVVAAYRRYRAAHARPAIRLEVVRRQVRLLSMVLHDWWGCLAERITVDHLGLSRRRHRGSDRIVDVTAEEFVESIVVYPSSTAHTFAAAEIRALYLACETPFERILFTTLFTTGMRINAFCSLAWPPDGTIGTELRATEKGNTVVTYGVAPVLRTLLDEWMRARSSVDTPRYLFPNRDHPDGHMSTCTARATFRRVADRAGVRGPHVHPHTVRHTVAWSASRHKRRDASSTLYGLGNPIESVANFIGHRSPQTTAEVYVALTRAERRQMMHVPWLPPVSNDDDDVHRRAIENACAMCSPYGSADGRTFPAPTVLGTVRRYLADVAKGSVAWMTQPPCTLRGFPSL